MPPSTMPRDHGRAHNKKPMVDARGIPVVQPSPSPRSQNRFRAIRIDDEANDEHSASSNITRLFHRKQGSDISSGTKRRKRLDDSRERKRPSHEKPPGELSTPPVMQEEAIETDEEAQTISEDEKVPAKASMETDNDSQKPTIYQDVLQETAADIDSEKTQRLADIDSQKTLCASQEPVKSDPRMLVDKSVKGIIALVDCEDTQVEVRPEEASKEDDDPADDDPKPTTKPPNTSNNTHEDDHQVETKPERSNQEDQDPGKAEANVDEKMSGTNEKESTTDKKQNNEDKKQINENEKQSNTNENQSVTGEDKKVDEEEERKRVEEERKRAAEEKKRLEQEKIKADIDELNAKVKQLVDYYKITRKIGEGTFSTVYEAVDLRHTTYKNETWQRQLWEGQRVTNPQAPAPTGNLVALKRVYTTSSPSRLTSEIKILQELRECPCVAPLITAFRHADEFFVVMPYIQSDDFKQIYREMSPFEIKCYFRSLFTGLSHLHAHNYIHRDVKPNNFLYSRELRSGVLIDFGLAEVMLHKECDRELKPKQKINTQRPEPRNQQQSKKRGSSTPTAGTSALADRPLLGNKENISQPPQVPGYYRNDNRQSLQANRAGTKGFRAPEILLRQRHQTGAIDVWSAGVILLCVITGRYPFFLATDDADAIIEIASLFGLDTVKELAKKKKLNLVTNLPLLVRTRPLDELCKRLNQEGLEPWGEKDTNDAMDLLKKSLQIDCDERITAKDALDHPFLVLDSSDDVPMAAG